MKKIFILISFILPLTGRTQIEDSSVRQVKLQGAINCRDLGGYATNDGHHVKWKKLYRSAAISKLTDSDLSVLTHKQITCVVDFRGVDESKKAPDRLYPGTDYILCPAGSDSALADMMKAIMTLKTGGDSMMKAYYARTDFLGGRYKPFFTKLISLPADQSILFHCTAGKDRTGIGTALLLYALGVSYSTIIDDYLASNYYRSEENKKMVSSMTLNMHVNEQVAKDMVSVRKEYLDATFNAIKQQYGSMDIFLKEALGLDEQKINIIRSKYLE